MSSTERHVVFLGLNFPPEPTGVSPYTGAMARGVARRGYSTRVFTTHPHYPTWTIEPGYGQWSRREKIDGVDVVRLRHYVPAIPRGLRRMASEASFGLRVAFRRWGKADAVVAVSPGLICTAIAAVRHRMSHPGTPFIVWVQDLYTLGLAETGQAGAFAVKAMAAVEGGLLRRADKVLVIHQRFADRIVEDFGVDRAKVEVVRNWTHLAPSPEVDIPATRARLGWGPDETVVLHAGNMGVKQGLDNVVEAARLAEARGSSVRFVLLGAGSESQHLKDIGAGVSTLQFVAPLDDQEFAAALASADCLLVNELPGVAEMAVPSKLTSYFSAGRPVVAATDIGGITAEEIRTADAGVVVPAGDPDALLTAATRLAADPAGCERLGANGQHYRHTVLDEETAIDAFTALLLQHPAEGGARRTTGRTPRAHREFTIMTGAPPRDQTGIDHRDNGAGRVIPGGVAAREGV